MDNLLIVKDWKLQPFTNPDGIGVRRVNDVYCEIIDRNFSDECLRFMGRMELVKESAFYPRKIQYDIFGYKYEFVDTSDTIDFVIAFEPRILKSNIGKVIKGKCYDEAVIKTAGMIAFFDAKYDMEVVNNCYLIKDGSNEITVVDKQIIRSFDIGLIPIRHILRSYGTENIDENVNIVKDIKLCLDENLCSGILDDIDMFSVFRDEIFDIYGNIRTFKDLKMVWEKWYKNFRVACLVRHILFNNWALVLQCIRNNEYEELWGLKVNNNARLLINKRLVALTGINFILDINYRDGLLYRYDGFVRRVIANIGDIRSLSFDINHARKWAYFIKCIGYENVTVMDKKVSEILKEDEDGRKDI